MKLSSKRVAALNNLEKLAKLTKGTRTKRAYVRRTGRMHNEGMLQTSASVGKKKNSAIRLEDVMREIQTLSMEVVEFERRAQDRYRSLLDENAKLKAIVEKLCDEIAEIRGGVHREHENKTVSTKKMRGGWKKKASTVSDLEPQKSVTVTESNVENRQNSPFFTSTARTRPRKRRAAAIKRKGEYADMLKIKVRAPRREKRAVKIPEVKKTDAELDAKSDGEISEQDDANIDPASDSDISARQLFKHSRIEPQQTSLPKPRKARRIEGGRTYFTEEWMVYAKSIYPIDPSHYWNIPQADYDLLIPDPDLEKLAKNQNKAAREHYIRSIYDWFRSQHRLAQLRVILSECDAPTDDSLLWDFYTKEMKRRGWPIYGRKLRDREVVAAKQEIVQAFVEADS